MRRTVNLVPVIDTGGFYTKEGGDRVGETEWEGQSGRDSRPSSPPLSAIFSSRWLKDFPSEAAVAVPLHHGYGKDETELKHRGKVGGGEANSWLHTTPKLA